MMFFVDGAYVWVELVLGPHMMFHVVDLAVAAFVESFSLSFRGDIVTLSIPDPSLFLSVCFVLAM